MRRRLPWLRLGEKQVAAFLEAELAEARLQPPH